MGKKSGIIKFNVTDRGREHTGQKRAFDTAAMCDLLNSPKVQERVKNRDIVGYYGHWPRIKFGFDVPEGAIVDGVAVILDHAFVTTHLKAYPDGTIEHEAEAMDNVPGRAVSDYWDSKQGGFSSAIKYVEAGSKQVPISFHGFDYVKEPNFTGNRPYAMALDSTDANPDEIREMMDGVVSEYSALIEYKDMLYASLAKSHKDALDALEVLAIENNDLIGRMSVGVLDSTAIPFEKVTRIDDAQSVLDSAAEFIDQPLARLDSVEDPVGDEEAENIRIAALRTLRR